MIRPASGKSTSALAAFVLALGALAGCSTAQTPQPESEDTIQSPSAEQEIQSGTGGEVEGEESQLETGDQQEWAFSSFQDRGPAPEIPAIITGIEAETNDGAGYDRIVVMFTGTGPVGWNAAYVGTALEQGRGNPLPMEGPAFLDVGITNTSIPETDEDYAVYYDGDTFFVPGLQITFDSTFEGVTRVVIGLEEERPFAVQMKTDPLRVVIDIQQ